MAIPNAEKGTRFTISLSRPFGTKEFRAHASLGGLDFHADGKSSGEAVANLLSMMFKPMSLPASSAVVTIEIKN